MIEISEVSEEINGLWGSTNSDTVHIKDLDEDAAHLIRKTQALSSHITPPTPHATDRSLVGRATIGEPTPPTLTGIESSLADASVRLEEINTRLTNDNPEPHTFDFPNVAWESVKAGLAKEKITNDQLNAHIKEAEKHQKDIDLLLDFSAELTAHKEGSTEMSEQMKSVLAKLKERGIDLWKSDDKTISKEKLSELKSLSSAQVDKLRSSLQITFTTKIQVLIQSIGAIMETLKDIIRNNTKVISAANRLPGH